MHHAEFDNIDDEALWLEIRNSNRQALEVLYRRLFKMLYQYGCKVSRNPTLVEDSLHDMFLDLWKYRENLFATTSVRFYLFSSLKRRMVKNNDTETKLSRFDFQAAQAMYEKEFTQEDLMIEREHEDQRIKRLKKHLQDLPPRQYEALLLRFYNEYSYEDIASMLDVNEQSARNLVQRGLELLRKYSEILFSYILVCLNTRFFF